MSTPKSPKSHLVKTAVTEDGLWVAASIESPYFYFEAPTREEALKLATRAFNFYYGVEGRIVSDALPKPKPKATLTRVRHRGTVNVYEAA